MRKFLGEFKEFISGGNVMDLAVAVIIGAAFTAIVNSVVSDLLMPIISGVLGGIDFSQMKLFLPLGEGQSAITYGNFINAVIQFLIIAFVIFLLVKVLNTFRAHAKKTTCEAHCIYCKEVILEGATRCSHCTSELPEPAKAVPTE